MNYYKHYKECYKALDPEDRKKSRLHWLEIHEQNLTEARPDLIMFSAQMLQSIYEAEEELALV